MLLVDKWQRILRQHEHGLSSILSATAALTPHLICSFKALIVCMYPSPKTEFFYTEQICQIKFYPQRLKSKSTLFR